jgi:uncharacterized LabA/DUF88 family protein
MIKKENNYAFIDSQNINLSIKSLGWNLDFKKFHIYLKEKYGITKAFLFIGYIEGNNDLYKSLQEAGFICIFKPTLIYKNGKTKGNCDAELVLQTMIELKNYEKAVIVTGDGDFHCLVKHLIQENKLKKLLIPNQNKYSALLKKFHSQYIAFISDLKHKLSYKKRTP